MKPRGANNEKNGQPPSAPRGKALLVVEDAEDLRYYFNILEEYGYRVRAYNSYPEGVRSLGEENFDFVLVTQGTHNFEGRCVVKRAMEIDRRLPVLVVARCLDMRCYVEAMHLGAADYLLEPLTVSEIGRVLENLAVQSIAS